MTRRHRLKSEEFSRRLREARAHAGLTQLALALAVGRKTKQAISELERANVGVTTEMCHGLAVALSVKPSWLAYGADVAGGSWLGYGKRLRLARESADMSQRQLAELVEYAGNSAIAYLEDEARGLEIGLAEKLATALRIAPTALAFGVPRSERLTRGG